MTNEAPYTKQTSTLMNLMYIKNILGHSFQPCVRMYVIAYLWVLNQCTKFLMKLFIYFDKDMCEWGWLGLKWCISLNVSKFNYASEPSLKRNMTVILPISVF